MNTLPENMHRRLFLRRNSPQKRKLQFHKEGIDFLSSDYLGYSKSKQLKDKIKESINELPMIGSTSSRLLSGHHKFIAKVEDELASFFKSESGLLFTSAYSLNIGLLAACTGREDILLLDEKAHTSLKNSLKLSQAQGFFFRHNDLEHLSHRLQSLRSKLAHKGDIFVVVESLYSMDGDLAPLSEIVDLCETYSASLIVDEAHGAGTIGPEGRGLTCALGLEKKVFARVVGFGKAFGTSGGLLLGNQDLMDYMANFCHSFIYTTGISFLNALSIKESLVNLQQDSKSLVRLNYLISYFNQKLRTKQSHSPLFSFIINPVEELIRISEALKKRGFQVQPIFSPTVKKGKERLRVCLHSYNTEEQIDSFIKILREFSYEA